MSSSSGVSDPVPVDSDDPMHSDPEVYTSDTESTDDDGFLPFALPDFGDDIQLADGIPAGDLPLAEIPAPIPLAAFPGKDLPLDVVSDDDVDLFEGLPEDDHEGGAPIADDVALPLVEIPDMEVHFDSSVSDSFELVASSIPPLGFGFIPRIDDDEDIEMEGEFDPVFPFDHDLDQEDELVLEEQPAEAPPAPVDPEPDIVPEHVLALDPVHEDAPVFVPPVIDALAIPPPVVEIPVMAPLPDPVFAELPVIALLFPDSAPVHADHAPFATHIDPRYADTRNGWIEEDDYPPYVIPVTPPTAPITAPLDIPLFPPHTKDVQRTDLPITFLHDIPLPRPGEGSSRQPFGHIPFMSGDSQFIPPISYPGFVPPMSSTVPVMSQFPHTTLPFTSAPHTTYPVSAPMGEPFLWSSPHVMPLSDPYHPFHVGYTTKDILTSLQLQQDALSRRIQELERAPRPPCHCQTPLAAPHAPFPSLPDSDIRFLPLDQQVAYLLCFAYALEEDLVHLRRLLFSHFPPPPPPSA
ncbi:calphotin-like [Helianthus annuus]|uniref:calphotin-like n=1 Tax=Helianthus annuus TaxID=4232 RepID=UPI0016531E0B|nr:calphotin-like [Helianthus annuus]